MAQTVALDIQINSEEGAKSLRTLKQEFKSIQTELDNISVGTDEYKSKLQQLANVKDQIDDLNDAIASQTGAGKFEAFAKVGSAIAGGFSAAQGAMALFGAESDDLQKNLLKVQAAMAFAQGIGQLEDLGNAFKNAKSVVLDFGKSAVSALQKIWATMMANPIVAIIAGLALITTGVIALMNAEDDETEALRKNIAERDILLDNLEKEKKKMDEINSLQLQLAKARGASIKEIRDLEDKQFKESSALAEKRLNENQKQISELQRLMRDADDEELKDLKEKHKNLLAEDENLFLERQKSIYQIQIIEAQRKADDEKKAKEDADKAKERQKENYQRAKENAEKQAQLQKELNNSLAQLRIDNIDNEREAAKAKEILDYENTRKEYETKFKGKKELNDLLFELENKHKNALSEIDNKFNIEEEKKRKEKEDKRLANEKEAIDKLRNQRLADLEAQSLETQIQNLKEGKKKELSIEQEVLFETKRFEILKSNKELTNEELRKLEAEHLLKISDLAQKQRDEQTAKEKEAAERRKQNIQFGIDSTVEGLQTLQTLVTSFAGKSEAQQRKAFEINKAAQIAETVITTVSGAQKAYASQIIAGDPTSPIRGAIAAALAVAAGVARVRQIEQTTFQSKSAPSGGTGGGGGEFAPTLGAPVTNTATNLSSIGFGQEQEPVKVFVTETDITGIQNKINKIEATATIK